MEGESDHRQGDEGATRHAYRLTKAGRDAPARWLTDPSEPVLEVSKEALLRPRLTTETFDDPLHRMTVNSASAGTSGRWRV